MIIWLYKRQISELLDKQRRFWNIKETHESQQNALFKMLRLSYIALKIFITFGLSCIIMFLVVPLTSAQEEPPFACWIPNKFYLNFVTIYVAQFLFLIYIYCLVTGFDGLFLSFCVNILIQFRILNTKIKMMRFDDKYSIKKIISHHNFLIEYER